MRGRRFWGVWGASAVILIAASACGPEGVAVGTMAPKLAVESASTGKTVNLSDYRGKVVVVDFWATWCGPCRQSMPVIEKLYVANRSRGLEAMAVSNEAKDDIANFMRNNPTQLPLFRDPFSEVWQDWGINGIPHTFIIGRDGKIVFSETGFNPKSFADALEAELAKA